MRTKEKGKKKVKHKFKNYSKSWPSHMNRKGKIPDSRYKKMCVLLPFVHASIAANRSLYGIAGAQECVCVCVLPFLVCASFFFLF